MVKEHRKTQSLLLSCKNTVNTTSSSSSSSSGQFNLSMPDLKQGLFLLISLVQRLSMHSL